MKKINIIAVLALCAFFVSCSSNPVGGNNSNRANGNSSNSVVGNSSNSVGANSSGSIVGKWKYTNSNAVMEYTSDGKTRSFDEKGKQMGPEMGYTTDGPGKITVKDGNIDPKCIYKIEGNKMTMACSSGPGQDSPKGFSDTNPTQVTFERK